MTRYRTIVADPPWAYDEPNAHFVRRDAGALLPYPSMTLDEIRALPVREMSDNHGEDAHLYLWTTSRYLPDAYSVAAGWGFHYAATLVWCKAPRGFGLGGTYQNNVEFILFCKRPKVTPRPDVLRVTTYLADAADRAQVGRYEVDEALGTSDMGGWWLSRLEHRCACPSWEQYRAIKHLVSAGDDMDELVRELNARKGTERKDSPQAATSRWFQWARGDHSAKPEAFMDMVESVSPGPYLELFSRRARLGWQTWGDESLHGGQAAVS